MLGIMSGTSIDSVDFAVCRFTAQRAELLEYWQVEFPSSLKRKLNAAAEGNLSSHELGQVHHDLGRFYAVGAKSEKAKFDLVGLHGQTVFHQPGKNPATLQIGEPAWLAEALRVPIVSNFRVQDMAAGGQGAPLATMFHKHVFAQRGKHIAVHNLGGISNVTSLDWTGPVLQILAFDTGPANVLLDTAARHFSGGRQVCDKNGLWAKRGQVNDRLLNAWLKHPFFRKSPPKSTGREVFGQPFFVKALEELKGESRENVLATLTEFTARSVSLNYQLHLRTPVDKVIVCGGGAANPFLCERLRAALGTAAALSTSAREGWPVQSIEPAAFALLAWLRWQNLPGNIPLTTGASRAVLLGQITASGI